MLLFYSHMANPVVKAKINKLIAAGVIGVK